MENLICPDCRKDFGVKEGMSGTNAQDCVSCGVAYTVMYVAGFNDGLNTPKKCYLIFKNGTPEKVVSSMEKFHKIIADNPENKITWLSYDIE